MVDRALLVDVGVVRDCPCAVTQFDARADVETVARQADELVTRRNGPNQINVSRSRWRSVS